mmetsp:Transcript_4562/g.8307  ORF Transcript_4562/g.8307 Transcript_4562/m.8307 type:complete len:201 (+) Transcript_4562:422-1024(+)
MQSQARHGQVTAPPRLRLRRPVNFVAEQRVTPRLRLHSQLVRAPSVRGKFHGRCFGCCKDLHYPHLRVTNDDRAATHPLSTTRSLPPAYIPFEHARLTLPHLQHIAPSVAQPTQFAGHYGKVLLLNLARPELSCHTSIHPRLFAQQKTPAGVFVQTVQRHQPSRRAIPPRQPHFQLSQNAAAAVPVAGGGCEARGFVHSE